MTVIVKADIIEDVNENLSTAFAADATALDRAIIKTLSDLSNRGLLVGNDTTQTLVDGGTTLVYPTGFRSAINITLINVSGSEQSPLIKLPGGHQEYRELRHNDNSSGTTEWYSEYDKKFFLWRPADRSYTTNIEYRKNHAKTPDDIEFTTEFENVMFAGVTAYHAMAKNRTSSISLWFPIYQDQLEQAALRFNTQPSILRG